MKPNKVVSALVIIAATAFAGAPPALVPQPVELKQTAGVFPLGPATAVVAPEGDAAADTIARQLAALLRPATALPLPVRAGAPGPDTIHLRIDAALADLGDEGYTLSVTPRGAVLAAARPAGLFYAAQTLRQLLPPEACARSPQTKVAWTVPCVEIRDRPRFPWRGAMVDVARHLFDLPTLKSFLDQMALQKQNVFHLHLTDDQGWRVEIRKYPELTTVGATRKESPRIDDRRRGDGTPYTGFLSQADLRELVAYAKSLHITVVPEIEMPGHALGALAAHPELSCAGGPFNVRTRWGIEPDVYCAGNDKVFAFLEDVLTEVLEIFPSEFIHIGGDECPKTRWKACAKCQARIKAEGLKDEHELQSWFIRRAGKFLNAKGRRIIGWDEILEGGLAPNAAVMAWRGGGKSGMEAAMEGHDVVMAPTSHCYLDYYQSRDLSREPPAIGGFIPLKAVYGYDPIPAGLPAEKRRHILGTQGNLWSEYIPTPEQLQYMAQPRLAALAETGWTPAEGKDWASFRARIETHLKRLAAMGFVGRPLDPDLIVVGGWKSGETGPEWKTLEWDLGAAVPRTGPVRIAFQHTTGAHRLDIEWAELAVGTCPPVRDTHKGVTGARSQDNVYGFTLPPNGSGRAVLRARVRSDGGSDAVGEILLESPR
jgi:hexosaminidase